MLARRKIAALFTLVFGCAVQPGPVEPAPTPTATATQSVPEIATEPATHSDAPPEVSGFGVGDRVSCKWKLGGTFYDGRVAELRTGGKLFIQYDDGDQEETTPDLCRLVRRVGRGAPFGVGDRVSCNWLGKGTLYDGVVAEMRPGGRIFIRYDDGDEEETTPDRCNSLGSGPQIGAGTFRAGDRVSCNWKRLGKFYDGQVGEVRPSGRIFIHYDDGDREETTPDLCRAGGPPPPPPPPLGGKFKKGDRVSCNWQSGGTFYEGRVAELRRGGKLFIQYDDGDQEETTPNLCRNHGGSGGTPTGPFSAGDRVACNWLGQGRFYSGRIAEVRAGGKLFIQYDDGDQEETTPRMCKRP